MDASTPSKSSRRWNWACAAQATVALAAAVASWVNVESILLSCPAAALTGFGIALGALRARDGEFLAFGLLHPLASAVAAMLIALLDWSPSEAAAPVPVLLTATALLEAVWAMRLALIAGARDGERPRRAGWSIRFNLRSLLIVVTVTCVLAALARQLEGQGETALFFSYAAVNLVVAGLLTAWFFSAVKEEDSDAIDDARTASPVASNGRENCRVVATDVEPEESEAGDATSRDP